MDETKKNLLSFGFVREYCKQNNLDFPPDDIVGLFAIWLLICDSFDTHLSHEEMDITTEIDAKYGECQTIVNKVGTGYGRTAICANICKRGDKQYWKFQINGDDWYNLKSVVIGIIDDSVLNQDNNKNIVDFSIEKGGFGLYLKNMLMYHAGNFWNTTTFEYGKQFNFKRNDIITMQLDLTGAKGILSLTTDADIEESNDANALSNILNKDLDVNVSWRGCSCIDGIR